MSVASEVIPNGELCLLVLNISVGVASFRSSFFPTPFTFCTCEVTGFIRNINNTDLRLYFTNRHFVANDTSQAIMFKRFTDSTFNFTPIDYNVFFFLLFNHMFVNRRKKNKKIWAPAFFINRHRRHRLIYHVMVCIFISVPFLENPMRWLHKFF